ncbi:hypothetical protein EDF60_3018 [Leucobacter luti]|nr:hypothetical protein [Leucobacter luti]TCK34341.1 hypothetical protein EDF60_3018 [Leucobacter luti]
MSHEYAQGPGQAREPVQGSDPAVHPAVPGSRERGVPAPPLPEPADPRSASELSALMFKSPLDNTKRVPAAPSPGTAAPRGGARPEFPVVYGPRTPVAPASVPAAPPSASGVPSGPSNAERAAQPSLAKQNRNFRRVALWGGTATVLCVTGALWGLTQLALSWI